MHTKSKTWKEVIMKIKTKVRAGLPADRCGGTRCGGTLYYA